MAFVLLTGAGFSHNWGAWLGSEAFEYLLGVSDVGTDLRQELWTDRNRGGNFETTLGRLQQGALSDATGRTARQVEVLTVALAGMFNQMNQGLARQEFQKGRDKKRELSSFLARFDAIFTLNQDLLLEIKYADEVLTTEPRRWNSFSSPGVAPTNNIEDLDRLGKVISHRAPMSSDQFRARPNAQPYFKLHGSSNWYDNNGTRMLVMGGNKSTAISKNPLLKWYADEFVRYVTTAGSRLMVIGYSFSDEHINDAIVQGSRAGLKVFVVDAKGADVLDRRSHLASIPLPVDDLMTVVQPALIGASRRLLHSTFGDDEVEYEKVMRFFLT